MAKGVPETHPEERQALNWSPKKNWVEKAGGLPSYINSVAVALVRGGMPRERAIPAAVNVIKKTCATGFWGGRPKAKVSPAIRAAACKAASEWEAKKGKSDLSACADCSKSIELATVVTSSRAQQPYTTNALLKPAKQLKPRHLKLLARANANLAKRGMPKGKRKVVMRSMARQMKQGKAVSLSHPIDLAFDPGEPRDAHGRWLHFLGKIADLKPGQSRILAGKTAVSRKRDGSGFVVRSSKHRVESKTASEAASHAMTAHALESLHGTTPLPKSATPKVPPAPKGSEPPKDWFAKGLAEAQRAGFKGATPKLKEGGKVGRGEFSTKGVPAAQVKEPSVATLIARYKQMHGRPPSAKQVAKLKASRRRGSSLSAPKAEAVELAFNPSQLRASKGSTGGGQWTVGAAAQSQQVSSDKQAQRNPNQVAALQRRFGLPVTGKYDKRTKAAAAVFKKAYMKASPKKKAAMRKRAGKRAQQKQKALAKARQLQQKAGLKLNRHERALVARAGGASNQKARVQAAKALAKSLRYNASAKAKQTRVQAKVARVRAAAARKAGRAQATNARKAATATARTQRQAATSQRQQAASAARAARQQQAAQRRQVANAVRTARALKAKPKPVPSGVSKARPSGGKLKSTIV